MVLRKSPSIICDGCPDMAMMDNKSWTNHLRQHHRDDHSQQQAARTHDMRVDQAYNFTKRQVIDVGSLDTFTDTYVSCHSTVTSPQHEFLRDFAHDLVTALGCRLDPPGTKFAFEIPLPATPQLGLQAHTIMVPVPPLPTTHPRRERRMSSPCCSTQPTTAVHHMPSCMPTEDAHTLPVYTSPSSPHMDTPSSASATRLSSRHPIAARTPSPLHVDSAQPSPTSPRLDTPGFAPAHAPLPLHGELAWHQIFSPPAQLNLYDCIASPPPRGLEASPPNKRVRLEIQASSPVSYVSPFDFLHGRFSE